MSTVIASSSRKLLLQGRHIAIYAILALLIAVMLFPFIWMVSTTLKPTSETFTLPPKLIPTQWLFSNYVKAWQSVDFTRVVANSLIVASATAVLSLIVSSLAAFAFAKYQFKGRGFLFMLLLGTLMIPFHARLIPLYLMLRDLGWLNTFAGLIVPRVGEAFGIFFIRQYFQTIPDELLSAARIDGCSEFGIYWRIMLPLAKPALAAIAIFEFVWRWNDLLWPLIVTSSSEMYTVQIAIANMVREFWVEWNLLLALCIIALLPVTILFLALQRHFVEGVAMSGIKG